MKRYLLIISAIINIIATWYLSVERPFGMLDQRTISDLYSTMITPAGYTFSIWSIIYTSWFFLWIYVLRYPKQIKKKSVYLLVLAQCLSTIWLIPSQLWYIPVSFAIMAWLFTALTLLLQRKQKNKYVSWVIQLFFWWILVASIANFHQTLVYFDIYFFPVLLSIISIMIGTIIVRNIFKQYCKAIPSYVLIWALIGIIVWQNNEFILWVAAVSMLFLGLEIWKTLLIAKNCK